MRLVGMSTDAVPQILTVGAAERADLTPLLGPWQVICERYGRELFDPQLSFFDEGDPQLRHFSRFVYHNLFPALPCDDEFACNVLRAMAALPCRSREHVIAALTSHVTEMTLPVIRRFG